MMKQMMAWILEQPKQLVLKQAEVPQCGRDEVLVHISAMCICNGSDPALYQGSEAYATPYVFGHEAVGIIEQMGVEVQGFSLGQRVIWWCTVGAFAEYVAVSPLKTSMFSVAPSIPDEQASMMELVIAASRALMPFSQEAKGKTLRILGLGPSGLVSVMYAKALGFRYIEGWDLREDRRTLAQALGADLTCNPGLKGFTVAGLPKADVSLDMAADDPIGDSLTLLCRCARNRGTIVSYGHPIHGRNFSPYVFQNASLTMISPENDHEVIRAKGRQVMDMVETDVIRLQPLISDVRNFSQLGESFADMLANPCDQLKLIFHF